MILSGIHRNVWFVIVNIVFTNIAFYVNTCEKIVKENTYLYNYSQVLLIWDSLKICFPSHLKCIFLDILWSQAK